MLFPLRKDEPRRSERRDIPPIDRQVPETLQTATFGSG